MAALEPVPEGWVEVSCVVCRGAGVFVAQVSVAAAWNRWRSFRREDLLPMVGPCPYCHGRRVLAIAAVVG